MNADYIHHRCVVLPSGGQRTTRHLLLIATALCLIGTVTTGCQSGTAHQAAVEPHYAQLEQVCFGYEPTVWRTMPGQCEQAVRLIPEEVVPLPVAPAAPATPGAAPPTEVAPGRSILDGVPEPSGDMPGILRGFEPEPTTPEGTETPEAKPTETSEAKPTETPAPEQPQEQPQEQSQVEPVPLQESTPEVPSVEVAPKKVVPETPQLPRTTDEKLSGREARKSVPSVAQRPLEPATNAAASELFRSVEQALAVKPSAANVAEQRPATKDSASGLARFISY